MNRLARRYPSPSLVVSFTALIVSLGGAGYSATGGNFILGVSNTATNRTTLSADINDRTLRLSNLSTGSNATALALNVASGHAPFAVNSTTRIPNLNADKLDGLDSTQFPNKVVIPFTVAAGANTAPIALPANRPVFVMGVTFIGSYGVGQVTLLRAPGVFLKWTGLESWAPFANSSITSGESSATGDHIVYLDNVREVDIEVNSADTIRVHNDSSQPRTGNVTLIW